MNLRIAPNLLISDVQHAFNSKFPYLKLEFFSKKVFSNSDYSSRQLVPNNRKIGDIQLRITDGELEITGEMKVKDLEKRLKDEFGLAAQVFRKSGTLWLETTLSDDWTLQQQNKHGAELSAPVETSRAEDDFDLQRDSDH